jgi:hypothetical protein
MLQLCDVQKHEEWGRKLFESIISIPGNVVLCFERDNNTKELYFFQVKLAQIQMLLSDMHIGLPTFSISLPGKNCYQESVGWSSYIKLVG